MITLLILKSSPNDQHKRSLFVNKNTVAIVISYSGESHEIKTIVDRIVDNKGTIIAITSINDSYLRNRANYCLTMCEQRKYCFENRNLFFKVK